MFKILNSAFEKPSVRAMVLSVFAFSVVNLLVIEFERIPVLEVIFFRAMISASICLFQLKKSKISIWGVNRKVLILRGLFGTLALSILFSSVRILPLGTAITIQYMNPLFCILIAGFVLGEKTSLRQWSLFGLAFLGVAFIQGLEWDSSSLFILVAVLGASFSAMAYTCIRVLRKTEDERVIIFYFPMVVLVLLTPYVLWNWVWPVGYEWGGLLLIGLFTQVGQVYLTRAYSLGPASEFLVLSYLGVVLAIAYGYFFFDEDLSPLTQLGIVAILVSAGLSQTPWAKKIKAES